MNTFLNGISFKILQGTQVSHFPEIRTGGMVTSTLKAIRSERRNGRSNSAKHARMAKKLFTDTQGPGAKASASSGASAPPVQNCAPPPHENFEIELNLSTTKFPREETFALNCQNSNSGLNESRRRTCEMCQYISKKRNVDN